MIDITAPKVLTPALLFAVLSPGLLIAFPPGDFMIQTCFHALVLCIANYLLVRYVFQLSTTTADIIVPGILFTLLTPGILLTIPPGSLPTAVGVHTAVFAVLYALIRGMFPQYY